MSARFGMKHSVKPSRGPDSTRSFSGSSGERRAKPFVLTTRGRASPSVSTSVSPYRKAASALSMSVSTRQSSACRMRPASSSAEARRLSDSRTGRTRLSLMVNESTMPSKKNIAQCRPFRPVASRTMNVSSPSNTDCMSAMLCARFSVNVIFCIKSPHGLIRYVFSVGMTAGARQRTLNRICEANYKNPGRLSRIFVFGREKVSVQELSDDSCCAKSKRVLSAKL